MDAGHEGRLLHQQRSLDRVLFPFFSMALFLALPLRDEVAGVSASRMAAAGVVLAALPWTVPCHQYATWRNPVLAASKMLVAARWVSPHLSNASVSGWHFCPCNCPLMSPGQ